MAPVERGDVLTVVGVAYDDTLNVRARPGTDQPVVTELTPTAEVSMTGQAWRLPSSDWYEVEVGPGWVSADQNVEAETVAELGRLYIQEILSRDRLLVGADRGPLVGPRTEAVVSVAPTDDEMTYDIVGFEDETYHGVRVRLVARRSEQSDPLTIDRPEITPLCSKGVDVRQPLRCA